MDIKRETLIPRVKNVQIEGSWVPATPVKPSVAISEPICSDKQEKQFNQVTSLESERYLHGNQICQTNWQESRKLSSGFLQEIQANGVPSRGESTNFIDANRGLDRWEDIEWHNLGFGELLALANAATGSSDPANVSRLSLGSKFQTNGNREPDMPQYGCSIPPRPFFDLNITPLMTTAELISSQFEPVTPDPSKRAENNQVSDVRNTTVEERTNQARDEQATDIVEVDELHHETEQPQLNKNMSSCAAVSTQLQEDHNPDKGTDLNITPQQKPRRKRHRPKVVREGKAARPRKPRTPKPESPTETPKVKRKYVRKKGLEKPLETTPGDTNPKILDSSPKSCRRSLNFDSETQVIDESSACKPPSNIDSESHEQNISTRDESTVQIGQGMEVRVENAQVGIAYDLTCSMNHVLKDYLSMPERLIPSPPTPSKIDDLRDKLMANAQNACTKGKCRIVFSDETHDKQASCMPMMSDINIDSAPKGLKRGHSNINDEAELSNKISSQCTSLQAYLAVHNMEMTSGVHFPAIYKKKRTEKPNSSVTSSTLSTVTAMQNQTKIAEINGSQEKQHPFNCMLALGPAEKSKGKRSKVTTRVRDLSSLIGMVGGKQSPNSIYKGATTSNIVERFEISQKPHTCMDALAADTRVTKATKKRTKRNPLAGTMPPNMHNHQQFGSKSKGPPPRIMWKAIPFIDGLVERFRHLDINAKSNQVVVREQNALVPINVKYQEQNAIVLYQRDGTVVPFEGSFDPVKKRRPRPKVDLDEETTRVWKLLLQDINSQGIDGTDEEKEKWWEEERRVFRGRADSFIARMHLVQGDRRFTMWKGSVVDSVVGVFLTQNVSDHLSSSAFMSLAAQFPPKSNVDYGPSDEERTTGLVQESEVCVRDPDETIGWHGDKSNQPACDQSSYSEEKEAINSSESFGSSTNPNCKLFDYSTNGLQIYHESAVCRSATHITGEVASCMGDQRETDDVISSQNSLVSSQNSVDSSMAQTAERTGSCSQSYSEAEVIAMSKPKSSFVELLRKVTGTTMLNRDNNQDSGHVSSSNQQFLNPTSRDVEVECFDVLGEESRFSGIPKKNGENCASEQSGLSAESATQATAPQIMTGGSQETSKSPSEISDNLEAEVNKALKSRRIAENLKNKGETFDVTESTNISKAQRNIAREKKNARIAKEKEGAVDWDSLRKQAQASGKREREAHTMDSVDWETIRCSDIDEIAHTIRERGMNNMLAARIKAFLNRLVRDHGSIDLEWLRDVPPDKAKEYLLSIRGLGLKSVECVRLLTLHHLAFPVDTNVGRIAVRLGWVPLQPLPESLQLHLLELYPILESIQKYLWPRLCKLDQRTLYELHYQMITFGKVFCTKSKPNCNACPMRGECRHFASAFASARLALPAPEEKGLVSSMESIEADHTHTGSIKKCLVSSMESIEADHTHTVSINRLQLPPPQQLEIQSRVVNCIPIIEEPASPEPIIELPATPEPERIQITECDIEDACGDPDEIPTIKLDIEEFTQNLQNYMQQNMELQEGDVSKALVALTPEAASIPMPKLKNVSRLRTEHNVYELPDSHPLLEGLDKREPDDPCSYLLAIWTPGETPDSIQPPEGGCNSQETGKLCDNETCFSCNNIREANSQTVRGTLLIPCRTAMRGSFPLNGTYFQVNEVFADHESSLNPIDVPRSWIWNLPRRTVYFGTSIPTIFKGLSTEGIQYCFWRGFVCVRGFDQKTRAPRPLMARLHFPASKLVTTKGKPGGS